MLAETISSSDSNLVKGLPDLDREFECLKNAFYS